MALFFVTREYKGPEPHPGTYVPNLYELLELCPGFSKEPASHLAYPPENPVFWIKYGCGILWKEAIAQSVAHRELQRLGLPTRAPAVFQAYEIRTKTTYGVYEFHINCGLIVMEYLPGKTAGACIDEGLLDKATVHRLIADAVSDLNRIRAPPDTPPSHVGGGRIRHTAFGEDRLQPPRKYENAQQLQDHFNLFLALNKRSRRMEGLSKEPLIFCYSDIHPGNFMIDERTRQVSVIDFADASYLPSSFLKFDLLSRTKDKLGFDITEMVDLPTAPGIDNTGALFAAYTPMIMSFGAFVRTGEKV